MSPLHVAYDMTFPNRNRAGTGEYARELLRALQSRQDVEMLPIAGPARSQPVRTVGWLLHGARKHIHRRSVDLLHCPALVAPLSVPVPLLITIHDSAVGRFPGGHPIEWRLFARHALPRLARRADAVITPTKFVRDELLTEWNLDPERVVAIYEGVSYEYSVSPDAPARPRYGPPRLLFAGAPIERKNLGLVLRAMASARRGSPVRDAQLLISGATAASFPGHASNISRLGLSTRVHWLGLLPKEAMLSLYRGVDLLLYPSLYEGFGLPPLEAMAAGTPVIAARAACLPETLGDAALMVDPHDADELADAVESLISDSALRTKMTAAGRARAGCFTWDRCAAATLAVYRCVADERSCASSTWS